MTRAPTSRTLTALLLAPPTTLFGYGGTTTLQAVNGNPLVLRPLYLDMYIPEDRRDHVLAMSAQVGNEIQWPAAESKTYADLCREGGVIYVPLPPAVYFTLHLFNIGPDLQIGHVRLICEVLR